MCIERGNDVVANERVNVLTVDVHHHGIWRRIAILLLALLIQLHRWRKGDWRRCGCRSSAKVRRHNPAVHRDYGAPCPRHRSVGGCGCSSSGGGTAPRFRICAATDCAKVAEQASDIGRRSAVDDEAWREGRHGERGCIATSSEWRSKHRPCKAPALTRQKGVRLRLSLRGVARARQEAVANPQDRA